MKKIIEQILKKEEEASKMVEEAEKKAGEMLDSARKEAGRILAEAEISAKREAREKLDSAEREAREKKDAAIRAFVKERTVPSAEREEKIRSAAEKTFNGIVLIKESPDRLF